MKSNQVCPLPLMMLSGELLNVEMPREIGGLKPLGNITGV